MTFKGRFYPNTELPFRLGFRLFQNTVAELLRIAASCFRYTATGKPILGQKGRDL